MARKQTSKTNPPAHAAAASDILASVDPPPTSAYIYSGPYRSRPGPDHKYESAQALQRDIDAYFTACRESDEFPTVTGLCLWLGISDETWARYGGRRAIDNENHSQQHVDLVKDATRRIEATWASRLARQGQAAGAIFYLKNCHGWRDIQEINVTAVVAALTDSELAYRLASAHQDLAALLPPSDVPSSSEDEDMGVDHNGR